ncbi:hypothetical protein KAU45_09650, partial [bacterium]|nr:hypothetical protein [bacterium]
DRAKIRKMFVDLINGVNKKMKGFSRRDTRDYYRSIIEKAWLQVEQGGSGELRIENWDRDLEWVMMDDDFDGRTRRAFDDVVVVHAPRWWGRYYGGAPSTGGTGGVPGRSGAPDRLPTLPGSRFANDVAGGATSFASSIMGDVGSFTGGVTSVTNPVPVSTSSGGRFGGGGGGECACACAGGGR